MSGSSAVDWELAERVAIRIATRNEVLDEYALKVMDDDFAEMTPKAERLVGEETGLWSNQGEARSKVVGRPDWIRANIASFQRLLKPLLGKIEDPDAKPGFGDELSRRFSGLEMGTVLGWMSTRVLGQYDLLIAEDENPQDQDLVYYVGPNIMALERMHGFDPKQFRLWIALHEVTHRAQFTGVDWLRDYFVGLVNETLDAVDADTGIMDVVTKIRDARREGKDLFSDGGLPALLAGPEQKEVLDKIAGMMSLLEGHGDVTMDRAGLGEVPDAPVFGAKLRSRRKSAKGFNRFFQRFLGFEAKLNQYSEGEGFIEGIEKVGGKDVINYAWERSENLPTLEEIREPDLWLKRVGVL